MRRPTRRVRQISQTTVDNADYNGIPGCCDDKVGRSKDQKPQLMDMEVTVSHLRTRSGHRSARGRGDELRTDTDKVRMSGWLAVDMLGMLLTRGVRSVGREKPRKAKIRSTSATTYDKSISRRAYKSSSLASVREKPVGSDIISCAPLAPLRPPSTHKHTNSWLLI